MPLSTGDANINEPQHKFSNNQSLCESLDYSLSVKLLAEYHLKFLSLKGCYTGSALVKLSHKNSHDASHIYNLTYILWLKHTKKAFFTVYFS